MMSLPAPAHAWGCKGHQVVALLAEMHLNPRALAMAKKILAEGPIDPSLSRYCKEGGSDPLADASTWPDDIRGIRPEASPWHYIDIPRGTNPRDVEKFCDAKEGCVTRAIRDDIAVLRSTDADPQKRADALRFLIHFVGDLHQPLHAVTNNDQGGNCVPVAFFDALPAIEKSADRKLRSEPARRVGYQHSRKRRQREKPWTRWLRTSINTFRRKMAGWQKGPANVDAWAWESYQLAAKNVYGKLPVRYPGGSSATDHVLRGRQSRFHAHAKAERAPGRAVSDHGGSDRPRTPRPGWSPVGHDPKRALAIVANVGGNRSRSYSAENASRTLPGRPLLTPT